MSNEQLSYAVEAIGGHIATVRGQKVILDADLARIYGVATKVLNQAVKRNSEKFPSDFMFQLAPQEVADLKSQSVTSSSEGNRSQIVTGSQKHRDPRFLPNVFTEHGAIMAATILNSPQAVQMSVYVVRAFVAMRSMLTDTRELARKLAKLEAEVKARLDTHDMAIIDILGRFLDIINPPESPQPEPTHKQIGFGVRDRGVRYRTKRG